MALLTVDEFRGYVPTDLGDAPLQGLLDAAEAEIDMAAGPVGSTVELFGGGNHLLALGRAISAITSITETYGTTVTTLAADDYLIHPGGYIIERLNTGTNSRWRWWGRITVTFTPTDDEALRKDVQRELVTLYLNSNPGLTSTTIGAWTEQYGQGSSADRNERQAILDRLSPGPTMVVVG